MSNENVKNGNTCLSRRSNMLHTHFHIAKAVAHLKSNYYSAVECDDQLHNLLKRWIYCERLLHFDFQLISARKSLGLLNLSYSTQLNIYNLRSYAIISINSEFCFKEELIILKKKRYYYNCGICLLTWYITKYMQSNKIIFSHIRK